MEAGHDGPEPQTEAPTSLSREVLRWIQSLDLAYSVKNARRDLSNGFLIAEILSRYYDVQMHSYDNGVAMRIKKDNWAQLVKFLGKVGLDLVSEAEVKAIVRCEDGAVVALVNKMYEALTQRTVQKVMRRPLPDVKPGYAKDTGSQAIKSSLRHSSLADERDELTRQIQVEHAVGAHERSIQEERSVDPERYSPTKKSTSSLRGRGPSRGISGEAPPAPQVTVKEIEVKQVDRSAVHRSYQPVDDEDDLIDVAGASSPTADGPMPSSPVAPPPDLDRVVCDVALEVDEVRAVVAGGEKATNEPEAVVQTVQALCAVVDSGTDGHPGGRIPSAIAAAILDALAEAAPDVAEACVADDASVAKAVSLALAPMRAAATPATLFEAASGFLIGLGHALARTRRGSIQKNRPREIAAWFAHQVLPELAELLAVEGMDARRRKTLDVAAAFTPSASKPALIARLKELLRDAPPEAFLACVCSLSRADLAASPANTHTPPPAELVDLYLYYLAVCLARPEPALHAAAVAALVRGLDRPGVLTPFLPSLALLARQDAWWETQAHLARLAAAALAPESAYFAAPEMRDTLLCLLHDVFHPAAPAPVRAVGLAALAPVVAQPTQDPSVKQAFAAVLLSLPDADLRVLLSPQAAESSDDLDRLCGQKLLSDLDPRPLPLSAVVGVDALFDLLTAYEPNANDGHVLDAALQILADARG